MTPEETFNQEVNLVPPEIKLNELETEGINITRLAQEEDAEYWQDDNHLEMVFREYNLWRQILISEQKIHLKKCTPYSKLLRRNPFVPGERLCWLAVPDRAKLAKRLFLCEYRSTCDPIY
ncbi:MAG: hypothetical protein A3A80_02970 [Candidatus Terrybacteria bacterium RIFCSPLOWO2_01_FULL_44_24]|uniref:Uncharacterized protein n=1 Tax=Candidatus Terrybacteria bacterium RIFCSPHIGHO2_01_FULL_43_35 TaxID=1802361 RepID=A0A1G2PEX8_9BACT|nr:MAG: hypothetical protein A2828_03155 [Candidatus Terrybacteria bacterium RIFCSPHIGHO2_01_FULL_43_35]OHA51026.1 MAG: hypothetical protein A3A80_02970 [Candidatus Terrybacteria bacterium RIFCSPLOWO2_01_FULL_44_24]